MTNRQSFSIPYLIAIVVMVGLSIAGIIAYTLLSPDIGHGAFIAFVSALVGPLMVGLLALIRTEQQARITVDIANEARDARREAREEARDAKEEAQKAREEAKITRELTEATHKLVNGQLDEFKDNIEALATEKGRKAGMEEGMTRSEARTDALHTAQDSVIRHEGVIRHEEAPIVEPREPEETERDQENPASEDR